MFCIVGFLHLGIVFYKLRNLIPNLAFADWVQQLGNQMATLQKKLIQRLKSLKDLSGVVIDVSPDEGTLHIRHDQHHAADFKFKWVDGTHYVGYFVDAKGNASQAIVSLLNPLDAVKFITLYMTLVELKARR